MTNSPTRPRPLFAQLLVFTDCTEVDQLLLQLRRVALDTVLFKDVNDPQGVGILALAEEPEDLVFDLREVLTSRVFRVLMQRHELSMIGRTMPGIGAGAVRDVVANVDWSWAVWHRLYATPGLLALDDDGQDAALATLLEGFDAEVGHLCFKSHGMQQAGNDFVNAIHGPDLGTVSAAIESMRRAERHDAYVSADGPFFVGRAVREDDPTGGPKARW